MTIDNYTDRERELRCAVADLQAENKDLQAKLAQQVAMVEKCMVAMNENADRGEKAEAKLAALEKQEPVAQLTHESIVGMAAIAGFGVKTHTSPPMLIVRHSNGSWVGVTEMLTDFAEQVYAAAGAAPVPMELEGIAETLKEGNGLWMTCNGCHESNEGHPNGPFSVIMNCTLGGGCSECGGIGAVWDTTDYEEMAESMACDLQSATPKEPA